MSLDGLGYIVRLSIELAPFILIVPGCVQKIGLVQVGDLYEVILESQKVRATPLYD